MPAPPGAQPRKRVHASPSTPVLRPSPLSQVLAPPPNDEHGDEDGGRTPTVRTREHHPRAHRHPHPHHHPRTTSGPTVAPPTPHRQHQQQPQFPQQQQTARRPATARSYFQSPIPLSPVSPSAFGLATSPSSPWDPYPSSLSSPAGPSQADYLNGGVGWIVPAQREARAIPAPAQKTRGRSHTVTAAHPGSPGSSSSLSSSPEQASSPPGTGAMHRSGSGSGSGSWSSKRRAAPSIPYWSRPYIQSTVRPARGVRGGSALLSPLDGCSVWLFGGFDGKGTSDEVWVLDTETGEWAKLECKRAGGGPGGPPPLRAHSAVMGDRAMFVFGGGSGDEFSAELWMLDTVEQTWYHLPCTPGPTPRRAHSAFLHGDHLYIYGGGSGVDALADLWRVDVSLPALARAHAEPLVWEEVLTAGSGPAGDGDGDEEEEALGDEEDGVGAGGRPPARGYMSATLVGDVLVVLGGQSGRDGKGAERDGPWGDCWVLDLLTMRWEEKRLNPPLGIASHTATLVGMYLFVFGGNDGRGYSNELHMLNLITMQWEAPKIRGHPPPKRAQHQAVLVDARLWILGGFDGKNYFEEPYVLDLAGSSYLVGVTEFAVGADEEGWD
ncbi:galactose oxidase [Calocera cornea HHB12733]|uniref:Galactose oxidase n=1 Tax=Calocera cornea HHB12733 TaxID=1353952 RepID=A0A165GIT7_9BASI|nr:galactose oxidase [Calocera cornea HHB12733]